MKIAQKFLMGVLLILGSIGHSHLCFAEQSLSLSIVLPDYVVDSSDLEVRDCHNRLVTSSKVKRSFEDFWQQSLQKKLLNSLTPAKLESLRLLSALWDSFTSVIAGPAQKFWEQIEGLLANKQWTRLLRAAQSAEFEILPSIESRCSPARYETPFSVYITLIISSTCLLR
jgi:hypothetical protein